MLKLAAVAAGKRFGPHGEPLSAVGSDAREEAEHKLFLKREKIDNERIIRKFKVLTIEDFEIADLLKGGDLHKEGDSWGNEN